MFDYRIVATFYSFFSCFSSMAQMVFGSLEMTLLQKITIKMLLLTLGNDFTVQMNYRSVQKHISFFF